MGLERSGAIGCEQVLPETVHTRSVHPTLWWILQFGCECSQMALNMLRIPTDCFGQFGSSDLALSSSS